MIDRHFPTTSAKVVKVIFTVSHRGSGTEKDPARLIYQYWSLEGELLAEHDTLFDVD
ncbi:MAG: carboxypeptidase [Phycisphaerae bacterium]|nr:carboxypeptidase [Phycisphaerae bacterium]